MIRYLLCIILLLSISACSSRARLEMRENRIPKSQLSQNYTNLSQDRYCEKEPIVRFSNFTFDRQDSLQIKIDITTSLNEEKLTGDLSILVDEYEIEYMGKLQTKLYLETLELESQTRYPPNFIGRQFLVNTLIRSATSRSVRKDSEKQYWNTLSILLDPQDEITMMNSADITFSVKTENCTLMIYPSHKQVKELKKFLTQISPTY